MGIDVISIGVTDAVQLNELRGISSLPQQEGNNWWRSPDFQGLDALLGHISTAVCQIAGKLNTKTLNV